MIKIFFTCKQSSPCLYTHPSILFYKLFFKISPGYPPGFRVAGPHLNLEMLRVLILSKRCFASNLQSVSGEKPLSDSVFFFVIAYS
jgi:hypothetical protein